MLIMPIDQIITLTADIVQAFGIFLALIALTREVRRARTDRDLQVILNLSSSFRRRWEDKWEDLCRPQLKKDISIEQYAFDNEKEIRHMLNWVDWLGTYIKTNLLSNHEVIFGSIGIPITEIIDIGRPLIEKDIEKYGKEHWSSLYVVARMLKIEWVKEFI